MCVSFISEFFSVFPDSAVGASVGPIVTVTCFSRAVLMVELICLRELILLGCDLFSVCSREEWRLHIGRNTFSSGV